MSEDPNLSGGGEQSPPMPEIPDFLRRVGVRDTDKIEAVDITVRRDEPVGTVEVVIELPPTPENIIDTIRKLAAKRDRIDETIIGLKEQLIGMVKKL